MGVAAGMEVTVNIPAMRVFAYLGALLALLAVGCQPSAAVPSAGPPASAPAAPAVQPTAASAPAASAPAAARVAPLSPPVPLRVGHIGTGSDLPVYVAIERGYFQEEGLEIAAVDFRTSAEMVPALASGQLDVGLGGVNAGLFNSVAQGIPLKIVADKAVNTPSDKSTGWMARTDLLDSGQLKEARDLKGLVVGVASPGSPGDIELDRMLRSGALTRDDVEIKPIPYADQPVAFANKSIDLAYVFEPTRTRLLEQGVARVWHTSGEVYPNHES